MKERRGRACSASGTRKGRQPKLDKKVEEDLIAENQRLRMEIEYLRLYRIIIFVQLRCQIFRQIVQIECRWAGARQTKFVQDDGKDASNVNQRTLCVLLKRRSR